MKTTTKALSAAPLSFEIDEELALRLKAMNDRLGSYPLSQVVALALEKFDFNRMDVASPERRQLSVRLAPEQRERLEAAASASGVSMAHLIRLALSQFAASQTRANQLRVVQKELASRRGRRSSAMPAPRVLVVPPAELAEARPGEGTARVPLRVHKKAVRRVVAKIPNRRPRPQK